MVAYLLKDGGPHLEALQMRWAGHNTSEHRILQRAVATGPVNVTQGKPPKGWGKAPWILRAGPGLHFGETATGARPWPSVWADRAAYSPSRFLPYSPANLDENAKSYTLKYMQASCAHKRQLSDFLMHDKY